MPPAPTNWEYITFQSDTATTTCPAGYGSPTMVQAVTLPSSNMCTCTCGGPPADLCIAGNAGLSFGDNNNPACTLNVTFFTSDGMCDSFNKTIGTSPGNHQLLFAKLAPVPLPPGPIACPSTPTLPPPNYIAGRTCAPTGGTCAGGGTCMANGSPPAGQQCIQAKGPGIQCPSSYPTPYTVVSAMSDAQDNRMCGACTCTSQAKKCVNPTLTLYSGPNCTTGGDIINTDGMCDSLNGADVTNDDHFKYSAMPDNLGCNAQSNMVPIQSGTVTFPTATTICCH
jgi:hypothetical protein